VRSGRLAWAAALAALAAPALAKDEAKALPGLRWAETFADAVLEATERNVPVFLHSHCNT
jgi:hypothetical protein